MLDRLKEFRTKAQSQDIDTMLTEELFKSKDIEA